MPANRSTSLWAETTLTPITKDVAKEEQIADRQKGSGLVKLELGKGVRKGTAPPKNAKSPYFLKTIFYRAYGTRKLRVK